MRKVAFGGLVALGLVALLLVGTAAIADEDGEITRLDGYYEVPAIATSGSATLRLRLDEENERIEWQLAWRDLEQGATPTQAHIHFGQRDVNGAIVVFFCTNVGNAPAPPVAPTPACPSGRSAELEGVFTPAHVSALAQTPQGIDRGSWDEFVDALVTGVTYANIHTARFPSGEVRGQIGEDRRDDNMKREDKASKHDDDDA